MPRPNRQILLVELPKGKLGPEHFPPGRGADCRRRRRARCCCGSRYISLDAANRAWMQGATYRSALEAGEVMAGRRAGRSRRVEAPGLAPGDLVFADTGWQDYAALPAKRLDEAAAARAVTHLLSVYGIAGLTAYFGLLRVRQAQGGRDGRGLGGGRLGRLDRRPDRQDQGLPRRSASPAAPRSAPGSTTSSASTRRSTTRPAPLRRR